MRVRVRLLGSLRQPSAPREPEYDLPDGADISTLIRSVVGEYPPLKGVLDGAGNLILLGGVEVGNLQGHTTRLGEGAEVVFIPVAHGGR